jgi:hypothetical protein
MAAKEFGAVFGIVPGFNAAQFGRVLVEHNAGDIHLAEEILDVSASLGYELIGEKVTVAEDDAECGTGHRVLLLIVAGKAKRPALAI